ncbi:MAG: hypothetical protein H6667_09875 [Ardenticatenaceae bacterium]|nr:hypothetical protein [Ardenticatenaceae bacterium]MCB9443396.1 hypothetical protein [Ardenticatenaceae bacterium]
MQKQYYVSGRYQARYPNGYHTGDIGISTHIQAKNEEAAKKAAQEKAIKEHGYVQFNWLNVNARQI